MKTIKKNVYYCDHCGKRLLSAGLMAKHEKHCTANPNRKCRLCKEERDIASFIESLKTRFKLTYEEPDYENFINGGYDVEWIGEPITLREIYDFTDGCPMCTFAIIRQTKLNYSAFKLGYDYKKDLAEYWKEHNDEMRERDERESYY